MPPTNIDCELLFYSTYDNAVIHLGLEKEDNEDFYFPRTFFVEKSIYLKITIVFTILYCIICGLSVGSIMYGAYNDQREMFDFGNTIVYFWMFNPVGLILSIVGLFGKAPMRWYILCMVFMIAAWLSGLMAVASIF